MHIWALVCCTVLEGWAVSNVIDIVWRVEKAKAVSAAIAKHQPCLAVALSEAIEGAVGGLDSFVVIRILNQPSVPPLEPGEQPQASL